MYYISGLLMGILTLNLGKYSWLLLYKAEKKSTIQILI